MKFRSLIVFILFIAVFLTCVRWIRGVLRFRNEQLKLYNERIAIIGMVHKIQLSNEAKLISHESQLAMAEFMSIDAQLHGDFVALNFSRVAINEETTALDFARRMIEKCKKAKSELGAVAHQHYRNYRFPFIWHLD